MGELTLDPEVIQVIDNYMENRPREPNFYCLERKCTPTLYHMAEKVFMNKCVRNRPVLKGEPFKENEWDRKYDDYFTGSMALSFSPYMRRCRWKYTYFLHGKCESYFENHSKEIAVIYLEARFGNIENAIMSTKCFLELCTDFTEWFEERRKDFLKEMDAAIAEIKKFQMSEKPQSHGGVANLLKALTKTMEKQGADITNIAKVQYAICIQAGIYIPDEFVQDVAVAMNILEDNEERSCEDGRKE